MSNVIKCRGSDEHCEQLDVCEALRECMWDRIKQQNQHVIAMRTHRYWLFKARITEKPVHVGNVVYVWRDNERLFSQRLAGIMRHGFAHKPVSSHSSAWSDAVMLSYTTTSI